ncbi:MAG: dUTP diphosphatase [Clostridiales bacterium]|nr:dUTP diphosphatase [Clostridiales bacterium]
MNIDVKIKLVREDVNIPEYATQGSAALDLRSASKESIIIAPGDRALIPTGIAISPESADVVALICARSGLASKKGLTLSNGVGVIDSDYRGEISVAMINLGHEACTIEFGERIAQLMFMPVMHAKFIKCDSLDETERGAGGFGSTGTK